VAAAEERANEAAARIMAAADAEVTTARQAAVEEVTARVGEIVLAAAERVIGREIQAADHQDLIDEAIAAVRAESTTGAAAGAAGGAR
jgi:F-type H+-transporting ATPase subunit b